MLLTQTRIICSALISFSFAAFALAAVPQTINYQGYLKNGSAPASGPVNMTFSLYSSASPRNNPVWRESAKPVVVTNGIYSTQLGSATTISATFDVPYYLGVLVGADATEMLQPLSSTGYAFRASTVDSVISSGTASNPNITLGSSANLAGGSGVTGATVSGGGETGAHCYDSSSGVYNRTCANIASNLYATVGGGSSNIASGQGASVGGGYANTSSGVDAAVGGGYGNTTSATYTTVGGGLLNTASFDAATVGGGFGNTASNYDATVGGGAKNIASGQFATIGGGSGNTSSGVEAAVGGGSSNTASGTDATVGGGTGNSAGGNYATVGGGNSNTTSGQWASVGGGYRNTASGETATVGGGYRNTTSAMYATVGGGLLNTASNSYSTVGGGNGNNTSGTFATVGGGSGNTSSATYATVGGGYANTSNGSFATIGGGYQNTAGGDFSWAGGRQATVRDAATALNTTGDQGTFVWADTQGAVFTSNGPNQFLIRAAGGVGINTNSPGAGLHLKGTGFPNSFLYLDTNAAGQDSGIRFYENGITVGAHLYWSAAAQNLKLYNGISVSGIDITNTGNVGIGTATPGSKLDVNGNANMSGSLVATTATITGNNNWNLDSSEGDFKVGNGTYRLKIGVPTGGGGAGDIAIKADGGQSHLSFIASGGTGIYSNTGRTAGVTLAAGGSAWAAVSDRNMKQDIEELDTFAILNKLSLLPVYSWRYKTEVSGARHVGPMAQDFYAAFGLGDSDKTITTVDADGISLAAIKALKAENDAQRVEIDDLKTRLYRLERVLGLKTP
jgi:hypothetical protein